MYQLYGQIALRSRTINRVSRILFLLFLLGYTLIACKKSDSNSPNKPSEPLKTEKGVPTGPPVQKMIGAEGGELTSADGNIKIIVAPGTVASPVAFSIEPITNTLYPERATEAAYRLKPEGTTFSKPVSVQFKYNVATLSAGQEDQLAMGWQTPEGTWKIEPTALDKTNRTLTVETTHFSDWTKFAVFELYTRQAVLRTSEETTIALLGKGSTSAADDEFLAPLDLAEAVNGAYRISSGKWKIIKGGGTLKTLKTTSGSAKIPSSVTYTAPDNITGNEEEVEIVVELEGQFNINDPKASGGVRRFSKLILITKLTIVKVHLSLRLGSEEIIFTGNEVSAIAPPNTSHTNIQAKNAQMQVDIQIIGKGVGAYPCGNVALEGKAGISIFRLSNADAYGTSYLKCNGGVGYSTNPVNITAFAEVGKIIEGGFAGVVFQQNTFQCDPPSLPAVISFAVPRSQ